MIEIIVKDYLEKNLSVPVVLENPDTPLEKFIKIEKTSSDEENYILFATLAIQSYANSLYESAHLNEEVKKAMRNIIALDSVSKAKLNSDYNFTDTTKKQYRYQAVFDLVYFD